MAEGLDLGISGLASGFDWRSLVDQLADVERAPQRRLVLDQQSLQDRKNAYSSIATQLGVLNNRVTDLASGTLFDSRTAQVSASAVASASVSAGAALASYAFEIDQMATAAVRSGTADIGSPLSAIDDVSSLALTNAAFPIPIKAGTFTINGQQITVTSTDTLAQVFTKISTATGSDISAAYSATTDRITLTSASDAEIVLGSATDTSNFLQAARLSNNGTDTVTSSSRLGSARTGVVLSSANLATTVTDGGAGAGKFKINGVEIDFNASEDTLAAVLKRINDSTAGVSASYDPVHDRFLLTNKETGDIGIALQDVTGNFLAATGLSAGTLTRGKDLLYSVNGGGQVASHSNTITDASSGLTGLSVSVLDEDDFTVTVSSDKAKIRKAITDFIDDYNRAQALVETNIASTTDAKGVVKAGTLAGESDAFNIASDLRRLVMTNEASLTATFKRLEAFGIAGNGTNNNLALADSTKLDAALASNLTELRDFFADEDNGFAVQLGGYLESMVGDEGTLEKKDGRLELQSAELTKQIADQERLVLFSRQRMIDQFVSMETAQQQINQQLQFLQQRFGT